MENHEIFFKGSVFKDASVLPGWLTREDAGEVQGRE
jgi:hypothetical protein